MDYVIRNKENLFINHSPNSNKNFYYSFDQNRLNTKKLKSMASLYFMIAIIFQPQSFLYINIQMVHHH